MSVGIAPKIAAPRHLAKFSGPSRENVSASGPCNRLLARAAFTLCTGLL
ncbi:hypothetical protein Ga0080559_TMP3988 [Salipiger profundus]|uniref:Uncharacterized protein n=1 Tax=Salipiger profundus TaxID=1229727 RepID=A0A1U7D9D6_9RHOB|nr:hypothetical protein Ga0080559_TMP3988 [Salipiger profundus]